MRIAVIRSHKVSYAVQLLLVTLIGGCFWWLSYQAQPWPIKNPDAEDMAQMARAWQNSEFTSSFMPLNGLEFLHLRGRSAAPPWPVITRFPLTPALMALGFAFVGPTTLGVALPSGIAIVLTFPLVFELTRRLANTTTAGWVAVTFLAMMRGDLFWTKGLGMTEPVSWVLLLVMACIMVRVPDAQGKTLPLAPWQIACLGCVLSLQILNRFTAIVLVPALLVYVWWISEQRLRDVAIFCLALGIPLIPWGLYSLQVTGSPFYNLQSGTAVAYRVPGGRNVLGWYAMEYIEVGDFVLTHISGIWQRAVKSLHRLYQDVPWLMPPVGFAFFVTSLLRTRRSDVRWLMGVAGFLFAVTVASVSFLVYYIPRYYVVFAPLALAFAGDMVWWLIRQSWPTAKRVASYALLVCCGVLLVLRGVNLYKAYQGRELPKYNPLLYVDTASDNQQAINTYLPEGSLVASNIPWSVAWQANRYAIPIPPRPEDIVSLETRYALSIDAIYLSTHFYIDNSPPEWEIWNTLRQQRSSLPGFILAHQFADGSVLYLKEATDL